MNSSVYYSSPVFEARRDMEYEALMARRELERQADERNRLAVERSKKTRVLS